MSNNRENILKSTNTRDIVYFLLKISVAGFLIYYLTSRFITLDLSIFSVRNGIYLYLGAGLTLLNIFIQFSKWKLLCREYFIIRGDKLIFKSLLTGIAAGIFTPARLGEFLGRGVLLKNQEMKEVMLTTIYEKLLNLFWILTAGVILLEFYLMRFLTLSLYYAIPVIFLTITIFYYLIRYVKTVSITNEKIERYTSRIPFLKKVLINLNEAKRIDDTVKRKLFYLSLGLYLTILVQYALFVSSYVGGYDFLNYLWTGGLVIFSTSIIPSVSIGDLGIRESASIVILSSFGCTQQTGFNASLLLFMFNIMIPSVFGLYYLITSK